MLNILTADMLSVEQLARNVPPQNMQQGREDYAHGLVTVESVEGPAARFQTLDHRNRRPYQVALWLSGNQISMTCTCREGYYWYACRHRVAAFIALREYLKQHPPKIWKAVLDQAGHAGARRSTPNYSPIIFSLQERGSGWVAIPYTLAARLFAAEELGDQQAIARAIEERGLSSQAKALRAPISRQAYPQASENTVAAANLVLGNPYASYGYGHGREGAYYETLLSFLPGCLVYLGGDGDPF